MEAGLKMLKKSKTNRFADSIKNFWGRYKKNRPALLGLFIIIFMTIIALLAPRIAPYNPYDIKLGQEYQFQPPSSDNYLGTDKFGRDVYSRLLYGSRISLLIGFMAGLISTIIGVTLGSISGYFGGLTDELIMRFADIFLTLPTFFLILMVAAMFGGSIWHVMFIIGITSWPGTTRQIRAQFLSLKSRPFVEAARSLGANDFHIIWREIMPNGIFPAFVSMSFRIGGAILTEAGLSFLGLGDPNKVSWGWMLNDSLKGFRLAWWLPVFPGIVITAVVIAFNLVGDGLNDAFNPRLKER
jgi:peptide/nickel transport system permease protein